MKKILFLTMAVAAMASCSQNDVTSEVSSKDRAPIAFGAQFGNTVSSRADVALDNSVSLGVFAYNGTPTASIYDGIEDMRLRYVSAATPAGWYLNPAEHYYPSDDTEVSFWAYGPKGNAHLSSIDCDAAKGPQFTLALNSTDIGPTAVDIFATQAVQTGKQSTASTAITFTLKHLLAQVKFEAKADTKASADNYDIKVYDIEVATNGTADYADKVWTNFSVPTTWKPVDEDDTQKTLTETAAPVGELVSLIPGQQTTITVKARVYKKNQSVMVTEQTATLELKETADLLKAGSLYTYTLTVTPKVGKITFSAPQVTDWTAVAGTVDIPKKDIP